MTCTCRPAPEDRCPSKQPGMSCTLPRGHALPHAKCVNVHGHSEHRAYEWWGYCHQEVVDRDGYLDACNEPATTSRLDLEDGHQYPVCRAHRSPEGATS